MKTRDQVEVASEQEKYDFLLPHVIGGCGVIIQKILPYGYYGDLFLEKTAVYCFNPRQMLYHPLRHIQQIKGVLPDTSVNFGYEDKAITRARAITSSPGWFGIKRWNNGKTVYSCCFAKDTRFSQLFGLSDDNYRPYSKIPREAIEHEKT